MLEQDIRETYRKMADAEMPLSHISIPAAGRAGRARQRRRRIGLIAAPVFAAVAVLAIALASLAVGGAPKPSAPAGPKGAPAHFSLTRPYGWITGLPYSSTALFTDITMTRTGEDAMFAPSPSLGLDLNVWAGGQCHVRAQKLYCAKLQPRGAFAPYPLGRRVGTLAGFPAYWQVTVHPGYPASTTLSWQYARGGWVVLYVTHEQNAAGLAQTLQFARTASFGTQAAPPVVYPLRLRSVPANWQVSYVEGSVWRGRLLTASTFALTPGTASLPIPGGVSGLTDKAPLFQLLDGAGLRGTHRIVYICPRGTSRVIGGATVVLSAYAHGVPMNLCARSAGGVHFQYWVGQHAEIGVVDLFASHLRLLGANPARWTTKPLG